MGASQSKVLGRYRGHDRDRPASHAPNPKPTSASVLNDLKIKNNNSNLNNLSGTGNIIMNNNPNLNLQSSPGASVHYSVNNIYAASSDPSVRTDLTS